MKIVLLDEAQERFEAEDRWWREHGDTKDLFLTEVEEALRQIASAPPVYYLHDVERDVIEVHSIRGARRKHGPALQEPVESLGNNLGTIAPKHEGSGCGSRGCVR